MIVVITCDSPHIINAQPNEAIIVTISLGGANSGNGADGKSAYQLALDGGFIGTQAQWLASLEGNDGEDGNDGKSAYQLALDGGFVGTQAQWLASLEGNDGEDGNDGKSAYQLALDGGFVGTEAQWLASLEGNDGYTPIKGTDYDDGNDGKSAYQLALDVGFVGTQAQWLASLEGEQGIPGNDLTLADCVDYSSISTINGFATYNIKIIRYYVIGKLLIVNFHIDGNGAGATAPSFTLPFNTKSNPSNFIFNSNCYLRNNAGNYMGIASVNAGSNTVNFQFFSTAASFGTWSNATNRIIRGTIILELE